MKFKNTTPPNGPFPLSQLTPNPLSVLGIPSLLLCVLVFGGFGCDESGGASRAYRAENAAQLIGGDVAMARVGDFILENDKIRIGILNTDASPAPGVFGGTLVDADLVRPQLKYSGGRGHDQLAECIPVVNLLWPRPEEGGVIIAKDGSDGGDAVVRVSGPGSVFLEALAILTPSSTFAGILKAIGVKNAVWIDTDYILSPGVRYVRLVTTVRLINEEGDVAPADGARALPPLTAPASIFGVLLGQLGGGQGQPGVLGGDFMFFGAQNDIFAPGIGFDEEKPIFDQLFQGKDPFTLPLAFDYMAAAGEAVSYGYFTANPGGKTPKVLVPIITSSSTAFVTHAENCGDGAGADCTDATSWTFERYFAVGDGDVASITDILHQVRGTAVGTLEGVVWGINGGAIPNGRVFLFRDPEPGEVFDSLDALVARNYNEVGHPGLLNAIDADAGLAIIDDGGFSATMPPGTYLAVATNQGRTAMSPVYRVSVSLDQTTTFAPQVPPPARLRFLVTDQSGQALESKLTFVPRLADGSLARRDGTRRPYLGEGRLGDGAKFVHYDIAGNGVIEIEPGDYRVFITHGPEYSRHEADVSLVSGRIETLTAALVHEVETEGWISGDFHLHAEPSFDSGMKLAERVKRALVEGVELAVATDHDIVTDYTPAVNALGVADRIKTAIGVEMSTLELGHFVGFPLQYDRRIIPDHGAPDWACLDGPALLDALGSKLAVGVDGVRIMAHPRDGFIGHISQLGWSPWDDSREVSSLETNNVLLALSSCDFEAMEVFNSKRFDLIRTPTNEEVVNYNRCDRRLQAATTRDALDVACPELSTGGPLAACPEGERLFDCQQRHRQRLAFLSARQILERTPGEQLTIWNHTPSADDVDSCDPFADEEPVAAEVADGPCVEHLGTYDDWLRMLDRGLAVTITGSSDSHGSAREPGWPRTYVQHDAASAKDIDVGAVAAAITDGRAQAGFGPFITARVGSAEVGDTATVSGDTFTLDLKVQTASWFGVDRIEVYVSGLLEKVIDVDHGPSKIVDFDGQVTLPVPSYDGYVAVVAMGLNEENLPTPTSFEVAFGELQLPRVAALAFGQLPPPLSTLFSDTPAVPDFFPIFPISATNAIFLDTDGDGAWMPPGQLPSLCAQACDLAAGADTCPGNLTCLKITTGETTRGQCGLASVTSGACQTGAPGTEGRVHVFGD